MYSVPVFGPPSPITDPRSRFVCIQLSLSLTHICPHLTNRAKVTLVRAASWHPVLATIYLSLAAGDSDRFTKYFIGKLGEGKSLSVYVFNLTLSALALF